MNLYNTQTSIVTALSAAFTTANLPFVAKDMPDNDNDFDKAVTNPVVYVVYTGSVADPSMSTNVIIQKRKASFTLEIHARKLYGANGMHAVRDVVEQVVTGLTPTNGERLYLVKDDIDKTADGIWVHMLQFTTVVRLVQKDDDDPIVVPDLEAINYPES